MARLDASRFLATCRGEKPDRTPVWFMRQAGRALPEYRRLRGTEAILDAVQRPDLVAEITLQPVKRYAVDAAVLFSDIMVPLAAMGVGVDIVAGVGPVTSPTFSSRSDLDRLRPYEPDADAPWVAESVRMLVAELDVPLIGFAGGPFTLASYLIEGRPTRDLSRTKALMYGEPALWADLLDRLAGISLASLLSQVNAGATAVQLFDSWVGAVSRADYDRFVLPASRKVLQGLDGAGVPRIHFGVGTGELLSSMQAAGAEVLGVDWRVSLSEALERAPGATAVQGNLDPAVCLAPWPVVQERVTEILENRPPGAGHIFNLGHGVLPETDPAVLQRIVETVHAWEPPAG